MDFFDLVKTRRSVRWFLDKPVGEDKVQAVLEAANRAPSAGNLQAYEIYVVREQRDRRTLARAAFGQDFIARAPVVLVFCTNQERAEAKYPERASLYSVQDAAVACTIALLAIANLGLATVWVGSFDTDAVRRVIGAPGGTKPVSMLPVGQAGERPQPTTRRALDDLVHEVKH